MRCIASELQVNGREISQLIYGTGNAVTRKNVVVGEIAMSVN